MADCTRGREALSGGGEARRARRRAGARGAKAIDMPGKADEVRIRPARPGDVAAMIAITAEVFGPFALERKIEDLLGRAGDADWVGLKAANIRRAVAWGASSCFVAEMGGRVVGFVTTTILEDASRGTIADLAVAADWQGRGLGRRLILRALERFRQLGLKQAKIETLACNPVGQHLYPSVGFREVVRQIHYVMRLE